MFRLVAAWGWLLTLIPFFPTAANASAPLSWDECVKVTAEKNPDIITAKAAMDSAQALYSGAYSGFFPQASATASYTDSSVGTVNTSATGGIISGTTSQGQYAAGLNVTQNIFNGFQDVGKVKQGKANLEYARAGLALSKATVSAALKTNFAQLLYEQLDVELNKAILKRQQNNLRLITLRFEGGNENKGNQLYQAATVAQAQYQLDHSIRQMRAAAKQLAVSLGSLEGEELRVKGDLTAKDLPVNLDFRSLARGNPNHLQTYYSQVAADAGVQIADQGWYPNVNLTGFVGRTGDNFPPDTNRWSVGLTLSFPFFPGTSQIFSSQSARALRVKADYALSSMDNNLISGLETAYANLKDAIQQWRVAQEFHDAAHARSIIADEKYNTGLMVFEDWTVIETDRINRDQTLLSSENNAMQAEAAWELALGTGAIP